MMIKLDFLFFLLFFQINSQIINNPCFLVESSYPFLLSTPTDDYYYMVISGESLKINKESNNVADSEDTMTYTSDFIYIFDNSNNNYIYYSNQYYKIIYEPFITFSTITVSSKSIYLGSYTMTNVGMIPRDNDFIIYGYYSNYLIFSSKSQEFRSSQKINGLSSKFSCKFIKNQDFICAMIYL